MALPCGEKQHVGADRRTPFVVRLAGDRRMTPSALRYPEKCSRVRLLLFSDRCGNCGFAFSATGSAKPQFPRWGRQGGPLGASTPTAWDGSWCISREGQAPPLRRGTDVGAGRDDAEQCSALRKQDPSTSLRMTAGPPGNAGAAGVGAGWRGTDVGVGQRARFYGGEGRGNEKQGLRRCSAGPVRAPDACLGLVTRECSSRLDRDTQSLGSDSSTTDSKSASWGSASSALAS